MSATHIRKCLNKPNEERSCGVSLYISKQDTNDLTIKGKRSFNKKKKNSNNNINAGPSNTEAVVENN